MTARRAALLRIGAIVLALGIITLLIVLLLVPAADDQPRPETRPTAPVAGLETEPVVCRELFKELRTVGKLDYNERRVAFLTARIAGRIDRVYADFTGVRVKQDDHLVEIYSPELLVTIQSLLDAISDGNKEVAELSRQRLRQWGILPEQLEEIEKTKKPRTHVTIHAPIAGTVIEKSVRQGQYVKEGDPLYRIAGLDPIWLFLDIYEFDLGWIRYGQKVELTVEAYPGDVVHGMVTFIDPFLNDQTRTVKVRVNLPNPHEKLKPAMYASATIRVGLRSDGTPAPTGLEGKYTCPMHPDIVKGSSGKCPLCQMRLERIPEVHPPTRKKRHDHNHHHEDAVADKAETGKVLAIPASAVLDTGRRKIAYRLREGTYELVELNLGPRAETRDERGRLISYYVVRDGVRFGDRVVVRGGFLLDSQRQIEGLPSLLYPEGRSPASLHGGHGHGSTPTAPPEAHKH